jgi:murein DD-endopeptidase MepM/ murein hydrolase activator NlpD
MRIYKPFKYTRMIQGYGKENTSPIVMPLYQSYGMLGHNGWDWIAKDGEPILWDCSCKGTVMDCHIDKSGGWGVRVMTHDKDGDFKHLFWHLKEFKCQAGQTLETGDIIGLADNTGNSTGTHLHRGLKPIKETKTNWVNAEPNNGYCGGIDISPYYEDIFMLDKMNQLKKKLTILQSMVGIVKKLLNLMKQKNEL